MSEEEKEKHAEDVTAAGVGRSSTPEEDLPPDLKAIEAELASLTPRTGRLDRERLIFLAGQQSVAAGDAGPANRRGGWGWPGAFAAMTAVAATLLVMLLSQLEAPGEVPIVEVPSGPTIEDGAPPEQESPGSFPDDGRVAPLPSPPEPSPKPAPRRSLFASVGLEWIRLPERGELGSEASYPRLLDRVLAGEIDDWPLPARVEGPRRASAPVSYRELLNQELGNPTPDKRVPDRPLIKTLLYPGANS